MANFSIIVAEVGGLDRALKLDKRAREGIMADLRWHGDASSKKKRDSKITKGSGVTRATNDSLLESMSPVGLGLLRSRGTLNPITLFSDPDWDREQASIRAAKIKNTSSSVKSKAVAPILILPKIHANQTQDETITSEGALVIFCVCSEPVKIVVQKDIDKARLGFAYGGFEQTDISIDYTAGREGSEETGIITPITKEHLVDSFTTGSHRVFVFFVRVPAGVKLAKGEEQEKVGTVSPETIDRWIEQGNTFHDNHARGWQMVRAKGLV